MNTWLNLAKNLLFPAQSSPDNLLKALEVNGIGILSASCCNPHAEDGDRQLRENLEQALSQLQRNVPVYQENISAAQAQLRKLNAELDSEQTQLVDKITHLFMGQGLGVFPILVVNRKIAFYGGVPTVDMLVKRLPELLAPNAGAAT